MADLNLTADSRQYQDLARDFAKNEIAAHAEHFDASGVFPLDIYRKAWDIGLVNVGIPEALGGLGLGALDAVVIAEELAAACAGITTAMLANDLALIPILVAGTNEQKNKFAKPATESFQLAGYSLPCQSSPRYQENGNKYVIHGEATMVNAEQAPWFLISATNQSQPNQTALFVIENGAGGTKLSQKLPALGLKCADIRTITFDAVSVASDSALGATSIDEAAAASIRVLSDTLIAAHAIGIARAALENSIRYSKERHTMGKPIAAHQAVGSMLADLAKDNEAARLLARKAAWLYDAGQPDASVSATAKVFACDGTMRGTTDAVQIYGGYGYSREYPVEKLMRDAKSLQLFFGNTTATKLEQGKQLLGIS